jgi:hypothetical protein
MVSTNADKSIGGGAVEHAPQQVVQPKPLPHLSNMADLLGEIGKIAESTGEDRSGDWSGSGAGAVARGTSGGQAGTSPRDQAIANVPSTPVMLKELEKHIVTEIKTLRKDIKSITRLRSPGAAFQLNELYTKMRHLHSLLREILEASYEVVKRLFVKVFIDKQPIL